MYLCVSTGQEPGTYDIGIFLEEIVSTHRARRQGS
jgi:hypothetical protein